MSVAVNLQNFSAPSENWDDDFDFHSQSGSPKRPNDPHGRPPTMRMSTATEDWDVDGPVTANPVLRHDLARPSNILTNKLNSTLANWVEDSPRTPQKALFSSGFSAENWDDDFLDKTDSPVRRSPRAIHTPSKSNTSGKLRAGVPLHHRRAPRHYEEEEHESWDDEFNLKSSPVKLGESSTPRRDQNTPVRHHVYPLPSRHDQFMSDDDDDDDADFGSPTTEEDRTVTARSRRAPQQHTPPPPVPTIPFSLTPLTATPSTSTSAYTHLSAPFPRSPTASVFSVPTSSVAETTSLRSTAPLRPSLTRIPANNTLRHLPPSPPIHRERRRLRKKSRPQEGVFELVDMNTNSHYPLSESEPEQQLDVMDEERTESPPPTVPEPAAVNIPSTPPQSTGSGGAILSRMGSLKNRWTGRKKKASLTPAEVSKNERRKDLPDNALEYQTPRPRSSRSSLLHATPSVPPPSSGWFFRPSSPANLRHRNSQGKGSKPRSSYTGSRSGSMTDLSMRGSTASSSNYDDDDDSLSRKLPKRKSLGFVQFRNGFLSNGLPDKGRIRDDDAESDALKRSASKRPMSMQTPSPSTFQSPPSLRHASYTTPKAKNLAASTDDLRESDFTKERERKQSTPKPVRLRARDQMKGKGREKERHGGNDNELEEGEDSRGFIRRLSFVGRHRRTKSGTSMSNIEPMERVPSESLTMPPPQTQPSDRPPSLPPLPPFLAIRMPRPPSPPSLSASSLLPPIELQPPSPPRNFDIPIETDTNDTNPDSMLPNSSPDSPSSPGYAITSSAPVPSASFAHHIKSFESVKSSQASRIAPSGYTASLGRSTISPKNSSIMDGAHRRNSLSDLKSDLKIPARISQAQQGLKRDLGMVRDFAVYIDQLKKQQDTYNDLVLQMQQKLDAQAQLAQQPMSRAVSPSFFNLTKPKTRARSNTNPSTPSTKYKELTAALYAINSRYRISWECAELLVELADGTTGTDGTPPASASAPVALGTSGEKRGRERAITLGGGDQSKPPTPTQGMSSSMILSPSTSSCSGPPPASPPAWRASTGRHDLSHRQLVLLREMLNNAEAVLSTTDGSGLPLTVPEETTPSSTTESLRVNRDWRWGGPMSSTITLPSETNGGEPRKKKPRVSKMVGIAGLRDILRALKKNVTDSALNPQIPPPPRPPMVHNHASASTGSLITDISSDLPKPKDQTQGRRPELGLGQEIIVNKERGRDPTPLSIEIPAPIKPRRPSLASIFRIGSRKNTPPSMSTADLHTQYSDRECSESSRPGTGLGSHDHNGLEEDWDKIDSVSDLDATAKSLADREMNRPSTLKKKRGNSPYLQYRAPSSSTSQLGRPCTPRRSASGSQLSIWAESPSKVRSRTPNHGAPRAPRLSNVDEAAEGTKSRVAGSQLRRSSSRASGRIKSGSIRSMPPQPVLSESRLAMTPENIKPLLENAKEIHARLVDCIVEIQQLLESEGVKEIIVSRSATGQSLPS